jgi:hypothetical protein
MEITSNMIIKADGTTAQNIKKGTGIKTPHLQDGAVTTAKIGNVAVTEIKIANGAVTESKLMDDSVTSSKIKDGSVGTTEIANGSVIESKLGDNSVTSSKIRDGSVGNAEIANGAVTSEKLANDSVTYEKLDSNTRGKLVTKGDSHTHSASDVGALPIIGGTVNGDVQFLGTLLGAAKDESGNVLKIVCGKAPEGNTNWKQYSDKSLFVDVAVCDFKSTPYYFVNVHGDGFNILLTGGSSAYSRTNKGFRIYVYIHASLSSITPEKANEFKWHVQWMAIGI